MYEIDNLPFRRVCSVLSPFSGTSTAKLAVDLGSGRQCVKPVFIIIQTVLTYKCSGWMSEGDGGCG